MSRQFLPLSFLALLISFGSLLAQNEELGLASFYSDDFHGRSTAYGDVYNKNELTCAHKRYGYGTMLRVTNLDNQKSVVVKVIDKGPFIKGRVVDLSRRAAELLGFTEKSTARVRVEPVSNARVDTPAPASEAAETSPAPTPSLQEPAAQPRSFEDAQLDPRRNPLADTEGATRTTTEERTTQAADAPSSTTAEAPDTPPQTTTSSSQPAKTRRALIGRDDLADGIYRIVLEKPEAGNYAVQVASFSNLDNVLQRVAELQDKWFDNILISTETMADSKIYRVLLGPFPDQKAAQHYQESLLSRYKIRGFVTTLVKP
jgi:rare lipoprotein A